MRLFGTSSFTSTSVPTPYISQSQRTRLPVSSLPLDLENQNLVVTAGSTMALNTSPTGLRMTISTFATGSASDAIHLLLFVILVLQRLLQIAQRFEAPAFV